MSEESEWQKRITGEWWGCPSTFDAEGRHVGFDQVNRSSVFEDGKTTYYMTTAFEGGSLLRPRFDVRDFEFGVIDSDENRLYLGPDFVGAGHPYGALVDANYYSPGWEADLRTMNHILPDGYRQVYSSMLMEGPVVVALFNGVYINEVGAHDDPEVRAKVDQWLEDERANGSKPHILPMKKSGRWIGDFEVYGADQQKAGDVEVEVIHTPKDLLRADQTVKITGDFEREYSFERFRNRMVHTYNGPDMYGNARGYGRALYTVQHAYADPFKVKGREFIVDDDYTMSVVWEWFDGDKRTHMVFGVLEWEAE